MPTLIVEKCDFCGHHNTRYRGSGEPCSKCGIFYPNTIPNTHDVTSTKCITCGNYGRHSDHYPRITRCPKCGHSGFSGWKAQAAAQYATASSRKTKSDKRKRK